MTAQEKADATAALMTIQNELPAMGSWVKPSQRDDNAWSQRFAQLKLDTDDHEAMGKFHLWRKRIVLLLHTMPWLLFPPFPDDKAMMSPDEKRVFEHYDKLLFITLCDIVSGRSLRPSS